LSALDKLFAKIPEFGASDLHICAGSPPLIRVNGDIKPLTMPAISPEQTKVALMELLTVEQRQLFEKTWNIDFCYDLPNVGRFRSNIFKQRKGIDGAFRYIPLNIPLPKDLGLNDVVTNLTNLHQGLVLVTGPTRSGKSTTLASLVQMINVREPSHVITIEDPIEFEFPQGRALINQREVGRHTKSTANALRAALREDPDIIVVGEMRDMETIRLAISAAETGHLVLSTLQTQNSYKTIDRIVDSFPADQAAQIRTMLSESLRGVVSQQLLKRADGKGLVLATEILLATVSLSNLIRDGKTFQIPSVIQTGAAIGMRKMDDSIVELFRNKKVLREDALRSLTNKDALDEPVAPLRKKSAAN
jgi:twitching motility protein PilT